MILSRFDTLEQQVCKLKNDTHRTQVLESSVTFTDDGNIVDNKRSAQNTKTMSTEIVAAIIYSIWYDTSRAHYL